MAKEIERKFRILNDSWRSEVQASQPMRQGYLCGNTRASVRVRVSGDRATLNIKSATLGVERSEFEYPVPLDDARVLLDELAGAIIEKSRHELRHGDHLWEIDEFAGLNQGLIVAEVELGDAKESFARPGWLGEEVSHDPRYYNTELARHPYTRW
ncbi:adenylate cyclase [Thioalkalivibrio nitratireducens DSM 14787]|uniref:Adenylate cyclase n=1 Tax=Thioalkalivibrio nitratireducens (strain DSM 14787 / UNIQEM 213 / ALEN2) TaxID=1255043 RepID=L0DVK6_THIND|nr:CYTH domain-containing protein [Thioalkalivibrio nitratireducens]AGA33047.1 adenylate cyclase [Thioalkalivibrio nitratireducens DSM 14787]